MMITLSTPEFAYLLATVGANEVIGLEAPELFPESESAQEKTYQQGLDELIANEWIEENTDEEGTYNFDPYLFEMVAIVGAPEHIVVTLSREEKQDYLQLNYLVDDQIVQLAALDDNEFSIGFVPEVKDLTGRAVELLQVADNGTGEAITLPMDLFEKMQQSNKKFSKSLKESLTGTEVSTEGAADLEAAFTSGRQGEIVVAGLEGAEVTHGRRAWIYGAGEGAWLFHLTSADAEQVTALPSAPAKVEGWIKDSLAELK